MFSISILIKHDLISGFQMHLDGTHLLGDILARALYQPLAQIGGELRPGVGGDIDAAAQRAAHVGGNLPDGVHFHRIGNEDTGLPVCVIHRQFHRYDRARVLQRRNFNIEPFALNLCRAYHHRITGMILSATAIGSSSRSLTACPSVTLCAP